MTTNNSGGPGPTTFIRAQNPVRDALYSAMSPSTAHIRTTRGSIITACSHCHKDDRADGVELRKCAKCKSIWYCSKECQKANWRIHKETCREVEHSLIKLTKSFLAIPILCNMLQVCLSLHFDLVENPALNTPLMVRVDVGLQPSDMNVFHRMYTGWYGEGRETEPDQIEGMYQINAITPISSDIKPYPHRVATWNKVRDELCTDGQATTPVIIVEFISNNYSGANTVYLPISSGALFIAKAKEPFVDMTDGSSEPLTPTTCLDFMNSFIRTDRTNKLLLRMNMREEDKETIRAAGRREDTPAVQILRSRLTREKIMIRSMENGPSA